MTLQKIVIHELFRDVEQVGVQTRYSQECIDITVEINNDRSTKLFDKLRLAFRTRNPLYSAFTEQPNDDDIVEESAEQNAENGNNENGRCAFPAKLNTYLGDIKNEDGDKVKTDADFITFSHEVLANLEDRFQNDRRFKGGFFVFTESANEEPKEYIDIFFVRDSRAFNFEWTDRHFDITDNPSVNTDKLVMSCQISLNSYTQDPSSECLNFFTNKGDERQFFYDWLCASEIKSSQEYTKAIIAILRDNLPTHSETGALLNPHTAEPLENEERFDIDKYDENILTALTSQNNGEIDVHNVSERIYGEREKLSELLEAGEQKVSLEFQVHADTLKQLNKIILKADSIELKFPKPYLTTEKIKIESLEDPQNPDRQIRRLAIYSEDLIETLLPDVPPHLLP